MIFLGAGASKLFGVKTLQDMTEDLIKKLKEDGHEEIVNDILVNLKRFNLKPDFEAIYTILEGLTDPKQSVRISGPFTAYVCKDLEEIKSKSKFRELLANFRKYIYKECTIDPQTMSDQKFVYDRLFETLKDTRKNDTRVFTTHMSRTSGAPTTGIDNTIVTTNYDVSVELYHRMIGHPLADGFQSTNDKFRERMDFSSYSRIEQDRWLIKLHGSIWHFKRENEVFKTITDPKHSPIPIKIDEQMMIYPIGEKPILKKPYYLFYDIFKSQIWGKMVAIGYSFRDIPVNIAILENLEYVKDSILIVVNPHAEEVIKNLGTSWEKFDNRIIRMNEKFGDERMYKRLLLAIGVKSWNQYKESIGRFG